MIPCERYLPNTQPFTITIHSSVLLVMDLHAHLLTTEVIGFLAGKWNAETKNLEIVASLPCKSVESQSSDAHYNVELDPTSEVQTRILVDELGLSIVGW